MSTQRTNSQYGKGAPRSNAPVAVAPVAGGNTANDSTRVTGLFHAKYQDGNVNMKRLEAYFKDGIDVPGIKIAPGTALSVQLFESGPSDKSPPAALFVRATGT